MKRLVDQHAGDFVVLLENINDSERTAIESALNTLEASTNHHIASFIAQLRSDIGAGRISTDSIERLSKWANSGYSFASAVAPAQKVSSLVLGLQLPRLIDSEGDRVDNYSALIENLKKQI